MSDLRKAAEQMLDAVDAVLYAAYDRAFLVCCGKCSESGCCGQPDQTWTPQDEALMALLGPVERNLRTALAAPEPKPDPVESDDDEEFTREHVTTLLLEVMDWTYAQAHRNRPMTEAEQKVLDDIRTALAAEQPKQEPTKQEPSDSLKAMKEAFRILTKPESGDLRWQVSDACDILRTAIRTAPPATHPGYVIGSHWLETAYSRICAGEAEADVLRDCGWERVDDIKALRRDAERYRWVLGWLVRSGLLSCETCRIDSPASYGNWWILRKPRSIDGGSFVAYGAELRDAIDAAMEASTAPSAAAVDASTAPEAKP